MEASFFFENCSATIFQIPNQPLSPSFSELNVPKSFPVTAIRFLNDQGRLRDIGEHTQRTITLCDQILPGRPLVNEYQLTHTMMDTKVKILRFRKVRYYIWLF